MTGILGLRLEEVEAMTHTEFEVAVDAANEMIKRYNFAGHRR